MSVTKLTSRTPQGQAGPALRACAPVLHGGSRSGSALLRLEQKLSSVSASGFLPPLAQWRRTGGRPSKSFPRWTNRGSQPPLLRRSSNLAVPWLSPNLSFLMITPSMNSQASATCVESLLCLTLFEIPATRPTQLIAFAQLAIGTKLRCGYLEGCQSNCEWRPARSRLPARERRRRLLGHQTNKPQSDPSYRCTRTWNRTTIGKEEKFVTNWTHAHGRRKSMT